MRLVRRNGRRGLGVDILFTVVVGYNMVSNGLPTCGHALARLWTTTVSLGRPSLIFSLVLVYYSTLISYVYN